MNTHPHRSEDDEDGFTFVEVMVSALLVAVFFASIFELNALCLRYMDSSKESLAALQSVQDRAEALRNLGFANLTSVSFVRDTVMPANYTPDNTPTLFSKKATEVVTIMKFPAPACDPCTPCYPCTRFTRSPNGSIATNFQATGLGAAGMVKVDVKVSWGMTLGGRARSEQTSSIVSDGTKK